MSNKVFRLAVGSLLFALCFPTEAQQQPKKVHRIGYLSLGLGIQPREEAFRQGLRELGYVDGQNIVIEWRFAKGKADLLPELVAELVHLKVDVIIASATQAIQAAKQATTTIPIVFPAAGDPVAYGLVASLARPGGNITGLTILAPELSGKRLELLKEAFPGIGRVAPSSMTRVYRNRSKKRRPQASSWESRFNRWKSEMLPMSSLHSQQ